MSSTPTLVDLAALERELTALEAVEAENMRKNMATPREHFAKVQNLRIRLLQGARLFLRNTAIS